MTKQQEKLQYEPLKERAMDGRACERAGERVGQYRC